MFRKRKNTNTSSTHSFLDTCRPQKICRKLVGVRGFIRKQWLSDLMLSVPKLIQSFCGLPFLFEKYTYMQSSRSDIEGDLFEGNINTHKENHDYSCRELVKVLVWK